MTTVYVVMSAYEQDDDGDWDRDIAAVHATREGAEADLVEPTEWLERYIVEMELGP